MIKNFSQKTGHGISIIIFTDHYAENLEQFLFNFQENYTYSPIEFIVFDQDITGKTEKIINQYATQYFIRLIRVKKLDFSISWKKIASQRAIYDQILFLKNNEKGLEWKGEFIGISGTGTKNRRVDAFIREFRARYGSIKEQHSLTMLHPNTQYPHLNILFVSHARMESNSGYHVQHYAQRALQSGMSCLVAFPSAGDNDQPIYEELNIQTYNQIEEKGLLFPDNRGPDIVHAWTPREHVRKFCHKLAKKYLFKTVIHLEDNEEYLTEHAVMQPRDKLTAMTRDELDKVVPHNRFHPIRGWQWLKQADGITCIIDTLQHFNPNNLPSIILPAPVDERLFYPRPINYELRKKLNIPEDHLVLAYIGNVRPLKKKEVLELYKAIAILNKQGTATTLIRTGKNFVSLDKDESWYKVFEKPLGWISRNQIPEILAAADILIQPGWPGPFDDQRVPAKLPEYFAMGRPVILPRTNLGLRADHGKDAWIVEKADSDGIVQAVKTIKDDPVLKEKLRNGAVNFYLHKMAYQSLKEEICNYYQTVAYGFSGLKTTEKGDKIFIDSNETSIEKNIHPDNKDRGFQGVDYIHASGHDHFQLTGTTPASKDIWENAFNSLQSMFSKDLEIITCMEHAILNDHLPQNKPWIGFVHAMPLKIPAWLSKLSPYNKLSNGIFFQSMIWRDLKDHCKGLYVFSKEHADQLRSIACVPVHSIRKPMQKMDKKWTWQAFEANQDKKLIQVGWWLQRVHAIYALPAIGLNKLWLKNPHHQLESIIKAEREYLKSRHVYFDFMSESVKIIKNCTIPFYENIMSENIAFVHFYDGNSLDLVMDCIARQTPLLINPYSSIREYLGNEYPLYYYFYKDAADKACDTELLREAHAHLKMLNDKYFSNVELSFADQIRQTI